MFISPWVGITFGRCFEEQRQEQPNWLRLTLSIQQRSRVNSVRLVIFA